MGTNVIHVLANNIRRRRYRFAGGASVLTVVVGLLVLFGPEFNGELLFGLGGGITAGDNVQEIHPGKTGELETGISSVLREVTGSRRSNSSYGTLPSTRAETPTTNRTSGKQTPLSPSNRKAIGSPYNPCDPATFPKRPSDDLKETFEWQRISERDTSTYVYAAHLDTRGDRRTVVIIAISNLFDVSSNYACQVWFDAADVASAEVTAVDVASHTETHGRKYAPTFYTCNYRTNSTTPFAVSLTTHESRCRTPHNILRISNFDRRSNDQPEVNFTVCVTPLNYAFDNFRLLVEMVELNRMFGAQRVVFYNYTTGSHVVPYFRNYAEEGVVVVLPWKLPVAVDVRGGRSKVEPEIHYFGQLAALNDCLYRNMFKSRFLVLTDLDEIVVPRRHGTWMEMMEEVGKNHGNGIASFHFRNVFYRTDYELDAAYLGNATVSGLQLRSLLVTTREETILPHGWRSKHIVNPQAVLSVGVHHIESMLDYNRFSTLNVDENAALLHHYRSWAEAETSRQRSRVDRYMHGFSQTILSRVLVVHQKVASKFKAVATVEELVAENRTTVF